MPKAGRTVLLLAAVCAWTALGSVASADASGLSFVGDFESGLTPWLANGGAVQCANYETPSKAPRLRGTFNFSNNEGELLGAGQSGLFTLPKDPNPKTYPLEACDLAPRGQPNTLPADDYYGLMVYVPLGWTIANKAFYGVNILELHFQNIVGSPVTLQLHPNHVTLALETGPCTNLPTITPGCKWRSNADNSSCASTTTYTCLPGYYAIPPGALVQGVWNEIILGVHWASDKSGQIQTWYRVKGAPTWLHAASVSGIPTVQWDTVKGCCGRTYVDELEAYTAALTAPLNVWLDNELIGDSFASVASRMPGGLLSIGGGGPGIGGTPGPGNAPPPSEPPPPKLSRLRVVPRVFALRGRHVGRRCVPPTRRNRHHRRCTRRLDLRLHFRLGAPATVSFTLQRVTNGRLDRGRCVAARRANRRHRRCSRVLTLPGSFVRVGHAGSNTMSFGGRLGRRRLGPGTYRLVATPIAGGRSGRASVARFRIAR